MGKLTVILGGARSGKSTLAEQMAARRGDQVLYIATAEPDDAEMAARITRHQQQRPQSWRTLETPCKIGEAVQLDRPEEDIILLDCLTLLVSNVILTACGDIDEPDEEAARRAVEGEITGLLAAIQDSQASWILVSNEVGLGLVPPYPLGRVYRDLLGWANRQFNHAADEIFFLIAGRVLPLHQLGQDLENYTES